MTAQAAASAEEIRRALRPARAGGAFRHHARTDMRDDFTPGLEVLLTPAQIAAIHAGLAFIDHFESARWFALAFDVTGEVVSERTRRLRQLACSFELTGTPAQLERLLEVLRDDVPRYGDAAAARGLGFDPAAAAGAQAALTAALAGV